MKQLPTHFAVIGAGGYAAAMADLILQKGADVQPPARLIAVVEPDQKTHADRLAALRQQGVLTFASYDEVLARPDIEAVWLPLPIALHRSYTERALAAGKAVLCEKPAAGSVQDVDAMIAARDRAKLPVVIGYQNMCEPAVHQLQSRLAAGAIGTLRHGTLVACWPRTEEYFRRNSWAGKFQHDGVWIMDSPPNNALAHYLQLSLFLLGGAPVKVEAELYRVLPIENFDTISLRVTFANNATLLVFLTHACRDTVQPRLLIEGSNGKAEWSMSESMIETVAGRETLRHEGRPQDHLLERFNRLVKGIPDETRLFASLEIARQQTVVINAASEVAKIIDVPRTSVDAFEKDGFHFQTIQGIEQAFATCAANRQMLHESTLFPWTQPPDSKDVTNYKHFSGPK